MDDYFRDNNHIQIRNIEQEKDVVTKVIQILNDLQNKDIYNFDLKPGNIMIDNNSNIKFIDYADGSDTVTVEHET